MRTVLVIVFAICVLPTAANAEFRSRETLLEECAPTSGDAQYGSKTVACYAYISGVADTGHLQGQWGSSLRFCLPAGATPKLLRDRLIPRIQSDPKLEGTPASFSVLFALATEFPCKTSEK